jgi:flagellar hook-associated protein 3 FlgL
MSTRVSTSQVFSSGLSHLSRLRGNEARTAEKAQTQKDVIKPSDNPTNWVRSQNLKAEISSADKTHTNASLAMHFMTAADTALSQVQQYVQSAHTLVVTAADSNAERGPILDQIRALWESSLSAMNARYGGRSIFAGFQTLKPAFERDGEYVGDDGRIEIHLEPGMNTVPMNVSAEKFFLGDDLPEGTNLVDTFTGLIEALEDDDLDEIRAQLPNLLQLNEQMSAARAEVAGRMSQVKQAIEAFGVEKIETLDAISKLEDVDAMKVFSELAKDQTVLKAALDTNHKVLTETPADILFK